MQGSQRFFYPCPIVPTGLMNLLRCPSSSWVPRRAKSTQVPETAAYTPYCRTLVVGQVGVKSFKSRSFQAWQESGDGHLFPGYAVGPHQVFRRSWLGSLTVFLSSCFFFFVCGSERHIGMYSRYSRGVCFWASFHSFEMYCHAMSNGELVFFRKVEIQSLRCSTYPLVLVAVKELGK